jgi:hypothetical protein
MSFGLLRTNVGLTTNIKIMVGSNDKLSLDSIESNDRLSLSRFKNFKFNKSTLYDDIIPVYYKDIPSETAFQIKNTSNKESMGSKFSNQFDDFYRYGARNISNNKDYKEEYEYFAPFYFDKKIPKKFVIFRVDGPGIELLTKENFRDKIINSLKVIKIFDLTNNSNIGQWLNLNFVENKFFPKSPLEIDFRNLEFSKWNGIDYQTGGYTSKSLFMDDIFNSEKEIFELERFIFNNFKESKIVFPNIINLCFLFDDIPSTPDIIRKWSINRYYGFYLDDMELKYTISPYKTPKLRSDVQILQSNLIFSPSSPNNPFEEDWVNTKPFYVEYKGIYYLVERYTETRGDKVSQIPDDGFISEDYQTVVVNFYKIISDLDLIGEQNNLNKNYGYIDNDILIFEDINILSDFDLADVWLIEIDNIYHKLLKQGDIIKISSDYEFKFNDNNYEYKVASTSKLVNIMVDFNNEPKKFNIFKCKFTDIKDFDTKIIDTEYSKFEYEKKNDLTITDETKMYLDDLSTDTNPKGVDDFVFKNKVVNIPVSSEYTANFETFKINENGLSDIWSINPIYCRWVFKNSLSSNDYPYVINNSSIFELFNRTTNPFETDPNRTERNLDYFYTINSSTSSYVHHSLHIEKVIDGSIDKDFKFNENEYINSDYDYFNYFFESKNHFDNSNIKKNIKKYSIFNDGDKSIPNITLFRGIEFRMYDVESIILDDNGDIENVNIYNSKEFDNYKFSILLTEDDNGMQWNIVDEWKMNKDYASGSTVLFEDILYTAIKDNRTDNPISELNVKSAPYNIESWTYSDISALGISQSIFWSPSKEYIENEFVYNFSEYYYNSLTSSNIDFWNPIIAQQNGGYDINSIVLFKGEYYESMTSSNIYPPDYMLNKTSKREFEDFDSDINVSFSQNNPLPSKSLSKYWNKIDKPNGVKWEKIKIWNPSDVYYTSGKLLIYHNDIIWSTTQSVDIGFEPGIDPIWNREYSIIPDTDYVYKVDNNPIIQLNNRYYIITNNPSNETLENGITVYINKKWNNILINIKYNDNTLPNLSNSDRDDIYDDIYKNLTAYNFISSINEFYNRYGFTDYLKYVVIENDGMVNRYSFNNNIKEIPHLLAAYPPDEVKVSFSSLNKTGFIPKINLNKSLDNGNIDDISKLNWYNNIPIAYTIIENNEPQKKVINYSGLRNPVTKIFRFSGHYMPLFYDIQLFKKHNDDMLVGNYKFDTTLTDFGIAKEFKIRKINRRGSILKLKDSTDNISMYPMIDEFGYTFTDFMIFKSTWDINYYIETLNSKRIIDDFRISEGKIEVPNDIGQSKVIKIKNLKKYNL